MISPRQTGEQISFPPPPLHRMHRTLMDFAVINLSNFLRARTYTECISNSDATERFTNLGKLNFLMVVWLCASQFSILPQLPLKTMLNLKMVKIDSKIIISLH